MKRKEKCSSSEFLASDQINEGGDAGSIPSKKRLRSSMEGPLYDKTKCVWCMKGEDVKHPDRVNSNLSRISTHSAWQRFKRQPLLIQENSQLSDRLSRLIDSISALSDPFASNIHYHRSCWQKYISHREIDYDDTIHLQNVSLSDVANL